MSTRDLTEEIKTIAWTMTQVGQVHDSDPIAQSHSLVLLEQRIVALCEELNVKGQQKNTSK